MPETVFSPEQDQMIQDLWAEGHSTAEIGRRMGISKNRVIGRAHRLKVQARPTPIQPRGDKLAPIKRVRQHTLPSLAQTTPVLPVREAPRPVYVAPRPVAPPAPLFGPVMDCQWPFGHPGKPGFRFCGDPSKPSKPYCPKHCKDAYVPVREPTEVWPTWGKAQGPHAAPAGV